MTMISSLILQAGEETGRTFGEFLKSGGELMIPIGACSVVMLALTMERLLALCRGAGVPLVINDDLPLALAIGADGVHLGRDDGDPAEARRALGRGRILGVSCYNEWARAEAGAAAGVDYLAFGAVYPSPTKPHAPRAGLELLARAKAGFGLPVAAIGGITLDNAAPLVTAGASLLAVISDVFSAPDPAARAAAYAGLFPGPSQETSA